MTKMGRARPMGGRLHMPNRLSPSKSDGSRVRISPNLKLNPAQFIPFRQLSLIKKFGPGLQEQKNMEFKIYKLSACSFLSRSHRLSIFLDHQLSSVANFFRSPTCTRIPISRLYKLILKCPQLSWQST